MAQLDHDLDVLNSANIDDLADLPTFAPWPEGTYLVTLETSLEEQEYEDDEGETRERIVPTMKVIYDSVIELTKRNAEPPEEGAAFTKRMYLRKRNGERNPGGEGEFKMVVAAVAHLFPDAQTNAERFERASGVKLSITTRIRKSKNKDTGEIREENEILAMMDPNQIAA